MPADQEKLLFIGTKLLGRRALERCADILGPERLCAVTMDDSTDERSDLAGIRAACEQRGVELDVITKPSQLSAVIQRQKPTVGLVLGWYWILPDSMLSLFPRGVLGIHASLLPSLRGNAPLVWARLLGLPETGVSLFYFDDGIDTGDIVGQMVIPIDDKDTIADLLAKADVCAADLIAANIEDLLRGTAPRVIQRTDGVSYVGLRRVEDGRIDWTRPARVVVNAIRAQTRPYPGAYTNLPDGTELRIWSATEFPHPYSGIPGRVAHRTEDGVTIVCGDGAIVVHDVDPSLDVLRWGLDLGQVN